jgi:hypothetical protein
VGSNPAESIESLVFAGHSFRELDVHESVHRDTTMPITNKMHYIDKFIIPSQIYMFRAMFSPIIRKT